MKHKKFFKFCCFLLLFIFICSYFIEISGYYEYNLANKKNLTNWQIQQFEKDIKEGKSIDLNRYLKDTQNDYSNKLTRTTSETSLRLNEYLKQIIGNTFSVMKRLFG